MATLAAPQPFFSCLTKGTSSHTPGAPAANRLPHKHSNTVTRLRVRTSMQPLLTDGDDDQDERRDGNQNDKQVAIVNSAGGKVGLRIGRARRQLGQFLIAQRGNRRLYLRGVHMSRSQSLLGARRGQELRNCLQVALPGLAGRHGLFLQVSRADYVSLGCEVRGESEKQRENSCHQGSNWLPN